MPAISEDDLHNLPPRDRRYDAPVADGLVLNVFPNGVKTWVHVHPFDGSLRRRTIGVFPDMSLDGALEALKQSQQLIRLDEEAPVARPDAGPSRFRRLVPVAMVAAGAGTIALLAARLLVGPADDPAAGGAPLDDPPPRAAARSGAATGIIQRADRAEIAPADATEPPAFPDTNTPEVPPGASTDTAPGGLAGTSRGVMADSPEARGLAADEPPSLPADALRERPETAGLRAPGHRAPTPVPTSPTASTEGSAAIGPDPATQRTDWTTATLLDRIGTPGLEQQFGANGSFDRAPTTMAVSARGPALARVDARVAATDSEPGPDAPSDSVADAAPGATSSTPAAPDDPADTTRAMSVREGDGEAAGTGEIPAFVEAERGADPAEGALTLSRLSDAMDNGEPAGEIGPALALRPDQTEALYYLTELRGMAGQTVTHRWEYRGEVVAERDYVVGGNRWRVFSEQPVGFEQTGDWRVAVSAADGSLLEERRFSVTADRPQSDPQSDGVAPVRVAGPPPGADQTGPLPADAMRSQPAGPGAPESRPESAGIAAVEKQPRLAAPAGTVTIDGGTVLPVVVLTNPARPGSAPDDGLSGAPSESEPDPSLMTRADPPIAADTSEPSETTPPEALDAEATSPDTPIEAAALAAAGGSARTGPSSTAGPQPGPDDMPQVEHILVGEVIKIRGTLLTLRALDGSGRSAYRVPRGATVLLDGVETRLQDLVPGQVINIKTGTQIRAVGR